MEFNATFIASAISFIVFALIMNAIFYKPLGKIVGERQELVDDHYEQAALAKERAEALLREKEQKLEHSRHDAKKIITEKADSAKQQKAALTGDAQQAAAGTISVAKDELQKSKTEAQDVLSTQVVELAQDISSKVLGEKISIETVDKNLINEMMQK